MNTKKLFCECPSLLTESAGSKIKRVLRSSVSELGEQDLVAKYELGKNRYAVYECPKESSCLIEIDEQPPNEINKESLNLALTVAKMLNCKTVDQIQVMRKQVIDYSNTSGFQRTMLIATDGFIETSKGKVRIDTVCLEEDSARKISEDKDYIIYRLDRLGIPLIEIATAPDLQDPEHIKEVAEYLGMILKSTKKFKSGLGTIRQDINVSVKGHPRVEIKGFQDLRSITKISDYEISRQLKLIEIHEKLKEIKNPEIKTLDLTDVFKNTRSNLIKSKLEFKGKVLGANLPGFKGILGLNFSENKRFGTELSSYAKAFGVGGIIHSDEDPKKYYISPEEINEIIKRLNVKENDGFILVVDQEDKAKLALEAAIKRAKMQYTGDFPPEVRKAEIDLTTSYLRPMPGAARMYVETDVPSMKITKEVMKEIKLPKLLNEEVKELASKYKISEDLIKEILKQDLEFENLISQYQKIEPNLIARILVEIPKEIKTRFNLDISKLTEKDFNKVLGFINEGKLTKDSALDALVDMINAGFIDFNKYKKVSNQEMDLEIKKIIEENKDASFNAIMGEIMKRLKGKVDSKQAIELIKKYMK